MHAVLADYTASISELKRSPKELLDRMGSDHTVAILNRNVPMAYLVPRVLYEKMIGEAKDSHLAIKANVEYDW